MSEERDADYCDVVFMARDFKEGKTKIQKAKAIIYENGTAEIIPNERFGKRFPRNPGEYLKADEFEHGWHAAISEIVDEKLRQKVEGKGDDSD